MKRFHYDEDRGVLRELGDDEQAPFSGRVIDEAEAASIRDAHIKEFDQAAKMQVEARRRIADLLIAELGADAKDAYLAFGVSED